MKFAFRGITVDLSWLQISDIVAIIIVLIATSFDLVPEKKVPNKWIRRLIIWGGALVLLVVQFLIFHNLTNAVAPLTNRLPEALEIRWYGILIMTGAVAATVLAAWGSKKRGIEKSYIWDMMPWLLLAGIVGARLWHVFTPTQMDQVNNQITTAYYLKNPLEILAIWRGGLGIPGAVMGGALAAWIYCMVKKIKFGDLADVVAPGLALAQAIGRWGNYFNQELYGLAAKPPLGIEIHQFDANGNLGEVIGTYLPIFWYESAWNLLNMGILLFLLIRMGKKLLRGDIFLVYIAFYSLGRYFLEYIRQDISIVGKGGLNINQTLMAVLFVFSVGFFVTRRVVLNARKKSSAAIDAEVIEGKEKITKAPSKAKKDRLPAAEVSGPKRAKKNPKSGD